MIKKIIRGKFGLAYTFWVIYFIPVFLLNLTAQHLIETKNIDMLSSTMLKIVLVLYILCIILYSIFSYIAIWNSSIRKNPKNIFSIIARAYIITSTIFFLLTVIFSIYYYISASNQSKIINSTMTQTKTREYYSLADKTHSSRQPTPYHAKFINLHSRHTNYLSGYSELGKIGEIEGSWALTNPDKHVPDKKKIKNGDAYFKLIAKQNIKWLKNIKYDSKAICFRKIEKCFESISSINYINGYIKSDLKVWKIKKWTDKQFIATYYDGCYNATVIIEVKASYDMKESAIKILRPIKNSVCTRGITGDMFIYTLINPRLLD